MAKEWTIKKKEKRKEKKRKTSKAYEPKAKTNK